MKKRTNYSHIEEVIFDLHLDKQVGCFSSCVPWYSRTIHSSSQSIIYKQYAASIFSDQMILLDSLIQAKGTSRSLNSGSCPREAYSPFRELS